MGKWERGDYQKRFDIQVKKKKLEKETFTI